MGRIWSEVRISCQMFALKVLLLSMGVTPRDSLGEISGGGMSSGDLLPGIVFLGFT